MRYNDLCEKCKKKAIIISTCLVMSGHVEDYDCTGIRCDMCYEGNNPEVISEVLCTKCKEKEKK